MMQRLILCVAVAMSAQACVLFSKVTYSEGGVGDGASIDGDTDGSVPDSSLVCPERRRDCDGLASNGCETPESASSCGPACMRCDLPNATAMCSNGTCAIQTCLAGRQDCNSMAADGCETDISSDSNHCGACDAQPCTGATPICLAGRCVAECPAGFTLCEGACVNLTTDLNNCGACGNLCQNTGVGTSVCVAGACNVACPPNYQDCDNNPRNGCTSLISASNCGSCNNPCGMTAGVQLLCARNLEDTASVCVLPSACTGVVRDGVCVNPQRSTDYCGASTMPPSAGMACNSPNRPGSCGAGSTCNSACAPGYADCDMNPANGCETSLRGIDNCGACGARCTIANGRGQCAGVSEETAECLIASCRSGFASCDRNPANGCEANLLTDAMNCGGCARPCVAPPNMHATGATCSVGQCAAVCERGFADCDGRIDNGCEVDLSNAGNCGACGVDCAALCGSNSAASCVVRTNGNRCQCGS